MREYQNPYANLDRVQPLPGMGGLGLFGVDLPDWIEKPVDFAVDASAAALTGGTSLLSPVSASQAIEHPGDTIHAITSAFGDGTFKDLAKKAGQLFGETLKTVGGGYNRPAAPPPSQAASAQSALSKYGPWVLGGLAVLGIGYMVLSD